MSARTRESRSDPALRPQPKRSGPDFWPTPKTLISALVQHVLPMLPAHVPIWECAAGDGRLARAILEAGRSVSASDLYPRDKTIERSDFLQHEPPLPGAIVTTNPPYSILDQFLSRGLLLLDRGNAAGLVLLLRHDHLQASGRVAAFNRAAFIVSCNWRARWIPGSTRQPRWTFRWVGWLADHHGPPITLHVREARS